MSDTETAEAPAAPPSQTLSIVALWVSDISRRRISDRVQSEVGTEAEEISSATDVAIVSTRLPVVRLRPIMQKIVDAGPKSIIALCHPGGEDIALTLLERGAQGMLAEGNEGALAAAYPDAALSEAPEDESGFIAQHDPLDPELLLTGFRQRLEMNGPRQSELSVEQVSGLPSASAFNRVLTERARRGNLPRVGHIEFANDRVVLETIDARTVGLVSRRLSLLLDGACASVGAELFAMGNLQYAFLADDLRDDEADELAAQIVTIGESFRPDGLEQLQAAVGHAGPDVGDNDRTLVELAMRASDAARRRGGGIVNAGRLSAEEAVEVELNAAFAAVQRLEELVGDRHGEAVAELAVELASELGYYRADVLRVRLTAQLHDIGKFGLDPEVIRTREEDLTSEQREVWQSHAERGADYLRISGGADIALAVRHHHERWDGSGFPDGLSEEDIPLDARLLAVVDRAVHLMSDQSIVDVIEALKEASGTEFDPSVVDAFTVMNAKHPDVVAQAALSA